MAYLRRWLAIRYVLALALAAQACVTFAHIHTAAHAKPRQASLLARTFLPPKQEPCAPSHHNDSGCLLCWAVAIGGTTAIPQLASIAAPEGGCVFAPTVAWEAEPAGSASVFDARGPPRLL